MPLSTTGFGSLRSRMTIASRTERITARDGGRFEGRLVAPAGGGGPGLLLVQEIFGVNDYIRARARALAALGYTVLCPDVFWRLQPGVELPQDEAGLEAALGYARRFDQAAGVDDLGRALDHLRLLPEVRDAGSRAGVVGFCLGGTLAWELAVRFDPATAVCYYGSGIRPGTGPALPRCPVLLHLGAEDPYIPATQVDEIRAAVAGRPDIEVHVHPGAGHAFDNDRDERFHHPAARLAAWTLTVEFLGRTLPARTGTDLG
jgi:carboxymethylenebutenolidase